jgi:ABC-type Zn uptake system ZnuABC Zn-binding protein ZnuA
MKDLVDKVTENSVKTAFKEPQFDDSNLKKFANEYNLTILNLDPL